MRAIIQRVTRSAVTVDGTQVASIGPGINVLVGIHRYDTLEDMQFIARKIVNLRIFDNKDGRMWMDSVKSTGGEILLVSQFTLFSVMKGFKLDFHNAMSAVDSSQMFDRLVEEVRSLYQADKVQTGVFGAMMDVDIHNDGPVTIMIDSPMKGMPSPKELEEEVDGDTATGSGSA
mgnify:FL=1